MSVRQRKWTSKTGEQKKAWVVNVTYNYPDGTKTRFRKVSPVQNKRAAEKYERDVIAWLSSYKTAQKEDDKEIKEEVTLTQFAKSFLEDYAQVNNKLSTIRSKEMILRIHLIPFFGKQKLGEIRPRDIERFKSQQVKRGLSKKTINEHLTVLRKLLSIAVEWEYLEQLPPIKRLKSPKPEFDFLDFDEADRFLVATVREPEWQPFFTIALRTGMRTGELLALRWCDVDFTAKKIFVRQNFVLGKTGTPKSGKSRTIDLGEDAVAALKEQRKRTALKGELVFSTETGGQVTKNIVKHPLRRAWTRAGLRPVNMKMLRHSFASHLVMAGVPLKVVQELMGHAQITTTMIYAHLAPSVLQDAVRLLDRKARKSHGTCAAHAEAKDCN